MAKHKHATVSLEQQLIAINKQAQHARHESFTTAARQTQFGSCDPVPQLYLPAPQLRSIVRRLKIDVIRYDIKKVYARAPRMVARVITFHFRVSLSDRLFRFKPSLYKGFPWNLLQQLTISSPRLRRTPIRIPLPHAIRMYEHALGRGSTGFRLPRANSTRLQPCLRHSALSACVRALGSADWPGNCICQARDTSTTDN